MKRVACYVRVSTEEQLKHGISVDNQIQELTNYCNDNNYKIVGIYNDAGISARKSYKKRPALLQLINDCQNGKIDLILFTKLDRWFRSVADYYEVQKILDECGVPWRALWEDYETETSSGIFKVNIMLSVAQSEADRTSERIKKVFDYKLQKGEYVGGNKAPVGYMRNGKQLIFNPDEKKATEAFFETYLSTLSQSKAIEVCCDNGVIINSCIAQRMLSHKAYCADLSYCSDAYITIDQYNFIQSKRRTPSRAHKDTGYNYIFSGLLVCSKCGCRMSGCRRVYKGLKKETHSIRYVCPNHNKGFGCDGSSISETTLENYLINTISDLLNDYNINVVSKPKNQNTGNLTRLKSRLKRIRDLYELGDLDLDEYKSKRLDILTEIDKIEKEPTQKMRRLPDNWLEIYNSLDIDHKKSFWSQTLDHIEINGMRCDNPIIIF